MRAILPLRSEWLAPALLIAFVALLEVTAALFIPRLTVWPGRLVLAGVVVLALGLTCSLAFRSARRIQSDLERSNLELSAQQQANLDLYGELELPVVLQRVVNQATRLLGARYGALSVIGEDGRVEQFITSGMDEAERERIGAPPVGRGLLGVTLREGERLRLENLGADPRSAGLPPHHPAMHSLLAVPVPAEEPFRANLYVAERNGGGAFTGDDERVLARFADQAALAIEKAFLHRRLQALAVAEERSRIGREMHDGLAQVLAYVNTKTQAVREYVLAGRREQAIQQLDQLSSAARDVLAEVREGILALRTGGGDRSFRQVVEEYLGKWRDQTGITVAAKIPSELTLDPGVELQLLRIIQEALSNVRKHSGAKQVTLDVEASRDGLRARIADPGVGFDSDHLERKGSPRFGLAIMRERAESVGGTVTVDSTPGRGTAVQVELPAV